MSKKETRPSLEAVRLLSTVLWPRFVEREGLVFADLPGCRPRGHVMFDSSLGMDRTAYEAFSSHLHVLDLFAHDPAVLDRRTLRYRRRHPHFRIAERLGRALVTAWCAKLEADFPADQFRVYYTADEDPVVRFHRVYPGERPWSEVADTASGRSIMLMTSGRLTNTRLHSTAQRRRQSRRG